VQPAADPVARFDDDRRVPRAFEVGRDGEAGRARSDDDDVALQSVAGWGWDTG
jgi:hypothetical protein